MKSGDRLYGKLRVQFNDEDDQKPTLAHPNLQYTFPKNVRIDSTDSSDLMDDSTSAQKAGTWQIANGDNGSVLTLKYDEGWLRHHPNNISASFRFGMILDNDADHENNQKPVQFPGVEKTVTFTFDTSEVSGSKSWKLNSDDTVTFTIDLHNGFNATNFVVTDDMGSDFEFVPGSFKLDDNQSSLDNVVINGQRATITVGKLAMSDNDGHKLTYKAKLSAAAKKRLLDGNALENGTDSNLNKATWRWDGSEHSDPVTTEPDFKYDMIKKSGELQESGEHKGQIKWTVLLNQGTIKADMGGYTFKDTLGTGQHYVGKFGLLKYVEKNDSITRQEVDLGNDAANIENKGDSFSYTFPENAGKYGYEIVYYTQPDSGVSEVQNTANITVSDSARPDGTATGVGDVPLVAKTMLDDSNVLNNGTISWQVTIKTSKMDANTDPASITLTDTPSAQPFANQSDGSSSNMTHSFMLDADGTTLREKPVLKISNTTTLEEGSDYTVQYVPQSGSTPAHMQIVFISGSEAVKQALGHNDITVTYSTVCSYTIPGYYGNTAMIDVAGKQSHDYAHEPVNNLVGKGGNNSVWDPSYDWGNDTYGAWITNWWIWANASKENADEGSVDVKNNPVRIVDQLPENTRFVAGSAKYNMRAGYKNGSDGVYRSDGNPIKPDISSDGRTLTFTIQPAKEMNGYVYARVEFQTATKRDGNSDQINLTNHASANAGDTPFGSNSFTVSGGRMFLRKTEPPWRTARTSYIPLMSIRSGMTSLQVPTP